MKGVLPVVALVECPVIWELDHSEVAEVFTVPLSHVLDRDRYTRIPFERDGEALFVWSMQWERHTIWGATAAMLLNFASRIENAGEI